MKKIWQKIENLFEKDTYWILTVFHTNEKFSQHSTMCISYNGVFPNKEALKRYIKETNGYDNFNILFMKQLSKKQYNKYITLE